jgi:hypothetical protein
MRTIPCYSRAKALLMMDNGSSHVTSDIFRFRGQNHIKIVTFVPYVTNAFQVLDVSFFRVFKRKEKFWMKQDDGETFPTTIRTIVRQFHSVATPENICGSFVLADFSYKTGVAPDVLEFWRERMVENPGLPQVWELSVPLESLRMLRQNAQFGLVDKANFEPFE